MWLKKIYFYSLICFILFYRFHVLYQVYQGRVKEWFISKPTQKQKRQRHTLLTLIFPTFIYHEHMKYIQMRIQQQQNTFPVTQCTEIAAFNVNSHWTPNNVQLLWPIPSSLYKCQCCFNKIKVLPFTGMCSTDFLPSLYSRPYGHVLTFEYQLTLFFLMNLLKK